MEWHDEYAATCPACHDLGKYSKQGPAACDDCRPELHPENEDVAMIYIMTRGQVITGGMDGVVIDISIPAVETAIRLRGIHPDNGWETMRRVRTLFHHFRAKGKA